MSKKMLTEERFNNLIDEYGTEILRLCYRYLKDYQLAEAEEKFAELIWKKEPIGSGAQGGMVKHVGFNSWWKCYKR